MTKTEQVKRNGKSGIKVTCMCATHATDANSAFIIGTTATAIDARKGADRDERIHGYVLLANHPVAMLRGKAAMKGVYAA